VKANRFIRVAAGSLLFILLLFAYLGSFRGFVSRHLTSTMIAGTTHTYMALTDTTLNRTLWWFYTPLLPYAFPAGPPVVWFSIPVFGPRGSTFDR
jgi:hypothetical protein